MVQDRLRVASNMKHLIFLSFFVASYAHHDGIHSVTVGRWNEIAELVNKNPASTWVASKLDNTNNDDSVMENYRVGVLQGSPPSSYVDDADATANFCENNGLPKEFDARKKWPKCESVIGHISDQGNCGSCWAVSAASVFSDRVCIASNGKIRKLFSGQQILSCCHRCAGKDGCHGGWPYTAFSYIKRNGLTTGGDYKSKEGCQPYLLRHCNHHTNSTEYPSCSSLKPEVAPKCKLHCYNHSHDKTYRQDKIRATRYYEVAPCAAQNEIMTNGSILATFTVYEDFFTYKSGVYQYTTGKIAGRHAVRIIGWGEEKGIPYWLVANSWNTHWGDEGLFKIKRGNDEVWFEEEFSAATPHIK